MTLRYGSVCSGIEAASVAWHPLGWRASFLSEIEAFPRAVLSHHYPEVPLHGDFTTIRAGEYEPIDLLVGGTPCQSFSVAGLRGGLSDERGNLALEYLRLADRLRPRWLVWENVPGVLSSAGGRDFGAILGGLVELGYGFAYRVLDAQYVRVDGFSRAVPQRRRRVFVVGRLGDWRRAAAVLFERESLSGNTPPRRQAGEGIAPTISARPTGGGGLGTDFDLDGGLVAADVAPTLNAHYGDKMGLENQHIDGGAGMFVAHSLRADGFDASEDGTGRGTPIVPVAFDMAQITSKANRTRVEAGLPASTLNAAGQMAVAFTIHGTDKTAKVASETNVAGAIRTKAPGAVENSSSTVALTGWRVRRLTPTECERLQGFPDGYTDIPWRGKEISPDGPRYKALGNSMAVNAMRWIGRRIEMVEGQGDHP